MAYATRYSIGFLIVPDGGDESDDSQTRLIHCDWDWASIASAMGWRPCQCGGTDGTVACKRCDRRLGIMLAEAYDWICEHEGESFEALDDYLPETADRETA